MQRKLVCLFIVAALLFVQIEADDDDDRLAEEDPSIPIDFEPMLPIEAKNKGLKCVPGRTTVHMRPNEKQKLNHNDDDEDDQDGRRTHMNFKEDRSKEECKICVCSQSGHDEYCSGRPAKNVNECLLLARLEEELKKNIPFDHERELSNRIRRYGDLIWHNDEIPYEHDARCQRGFSYYTNSLYAEHTDIDVGSEIDSLLDYSHKDVCFYCVCATNARNVSCIHRNPWFCDYYRTLRHGDAMRADYAKTYMQDRPAYFRTLSYRLRRTMDWGLIDMIDIAQKSLGRPACIPYVSEYSDCSEYTTCRGCNQCRCSAEGQWVCYKKRNTCSEDDDMEIFEDGTDENLVGNILKELAQKEREERPRKRPTNRAPLPEKRKRVTESPILGLDDEEVVKELRLIMRGARSVGDFNETHGPIKFHHTVDEINEDTLKNSNISGTLVMQKVPMVPSGRGNRRAGVFVNSTTNPLHIDYNHPSIYNNHITDNKIESAHIDQYDALINEKLHNVINYTQNAKDKEISKLVVNELKRGTETIGDPNAPVTSNITFTPEKDTLTAMAFIAGNLLNKLWNIERDIADDSIEVDNMKNQKIADLLDLFKEPLTYRQELFLKDALEQLSEAVNKNKGNKHFSLCETIDKVKDEIVSADTVQEVKKPEIKQRAEEESSASNALSKLIEVLNLIKKYETVQTNLKEIKRPKYAMRNAPEMSAQNNTKADKSSLNLFGNILTKITNLLIPNKNSKIKNKIKSQNMLRGSHHLDDDVKRVFNLNLDSARISSADKLILDYINRLQTHPCPSSNLPEDKSIRFKESDILLNLSEFFKIKSYSDLLNIVRPKPSSTQPTPILGNGHEGRRAGNNDSITEIDNNNNTSSINEKLKVHLKAIVNDLIELQHSKGRDIKSGEINIADALPCIFKTLNQEDQPKPTKLYTHNALLNKIKNVLEAVKKDIKELPLSRRSNIISGLRPKSAVVWERMVKNFDENPKSTRRFFKIVKPQTYESVKKLIDYIETNKSNSYKTAALRNGVPAADKLLFLKTLAMDSGSYANVLGKLLVLNREKKLPENELQDLIEFVDSGIANLELNKKVLNSLDEKNKKTFNVLASNNQARGSIKKPNDNSKVNSEQTVNQIMRNRVNQYLKLKESEGATRDVGYDIARRILFNLERGSEKLARELYKILIETSQREKNSPASTQVTKPALADKRTIKLEEPSKKQWASEDMFLKTLESAWANLQSI